MDHSDALRPGAPLAQIGDAERRGRLRPGQTIVEASSRNTGISLALF